MPEEKPGEVEIVRPNHGEPAPAPGDNKIVLARHVFPPTLPIIPLNNRPPFPKMTAPMIIEDERIKTLIIETTRSSSKFVGLVLRRSSETPSDDQDKSLRLEDLHAVGGIAEILQAAQGGPDGPVQVMLGVLGRIRLGTVVRTEPYLVARVEYIHETEMVDNEELKAYSIAVIQSIKELIALNPLHKEELGLFLSHSDLAEPGRLADFAGSLTSASGEELQDILETVSIRSRLHKVLFLLKKEIDISKIQVRINKQIEEKLSKQQREFFLREQLKAIKKELGLQKEGKEAEIERFQERLAPLTLTKEAEERINEEMDKLKLLEPASPEFAVTRTYLDWLTILPWGVFTDDRYDLRRAEQVLNRDHYGLDDVKQRILEFLAVGIMKGNISGSILCFVGPPGVGKTSIGHSIADSIGRHFYRFSVGGIRDEAEIKGHRRTYIGALPGKFIQAIKVCKSANPVIMLDEIDKIGASYQGDPASALLEVLDPEQNRDFLDHYLDVRFDLSNIFFICTANQIDTIPRPLLDRMEVIKLAGYIMQEKLAIAQQFLIPKQLERHGIRRNQLTITTPALRHVIDGYAREPGVRSLEKHIGKIMRRSARRIVEGHAERIRVDTADIPDLLGKRLFLDDAVRYGQRAGVVTGLAWTSLGGDTLRVEAAGVETGKPGFKHTGQLGNVMVESTEIAYTYVQSFLNQDPKAREFFSTHFIHIHVPAGATPKDGPSAGITMACAIYSLTLGRPVPDHIAMTGELTLTGQVMPIGGVKEKTIAAKRAKIATLIFPEENRKDFEDLPAAIRKGLKPHFVKTFADVVAICFPVKPSRQPAARKRTAAHPPSRGRRTSRRRP